MRCQKARIHLSDFLHQTLDPTLEAKIREHLELCSDCAAEVRFLKAYREKTLNQPFEKAPDEFLAKVRQRLDTPNPTGGRRLWQRFLQWRLPLVPQFAGLAMVVLILILVFRIHDQLPYNKLPLNVSEKADQRGRGAITSQSDNAKQVQAPLPDMVFKKQIGTGLSKRVESPGNTSVTAKSAVVTSPTSSAGSSNSISTTEEAASVMPRVSEYIDNQKSVPEEPVAAPLTDYSATPRIIRLVIASPVTPDQAASGGAGQLFKMKEEAKPKGTKSVQREMPEQDVPENDVRTGLQKLLDKYKGHIAPIKNNPEKQIQIWILEIPNQQYQEFLTELEKIGQVTEMAEPMNTLAREPGEEVELQLQLGQD